MAVFLFLLAFICILISGIYAPIIALIYLFIGFLVLTSYPTRIIISREADRLSLGNWANWEEEYKPVPEKKILYFKILVSLSCIIIWPLFLSVILTEKMSFSKPDTTLKSFEEHMSDLEGGLTFSYIGGAGTINCKDCNFSHGLTSFTHGYVQGEKGEMFPSCSSGYQCQSCGKFTSRSKTEPFAESNYTHTLEGVPEEQRAHRIEQIQGWVRGLEYDMKKKPKKEWRPEWKQKWIDYNRELNTVTPEELKAIKDKREESDREYAASLFCDCGGELKRDQILFCPQCKSKNLKYDMGFIT